MLVNFNEDEKEAVLQTVNNLKTLKQLQLIGYTIPSIQFGTCNDDMIMDQEEFAISVLDLITEGNYKMDYIRPDKYGYCDADDDEGELLNEVRILHPHLVNYMKMGENLDYFKRLVYSMISTKYTWITDYTTYDFQILEEENCICIVCSDFLFFDSYFVESLVGLINYCEIELQGGIKTDVNIVNG